MSVSSYVGAGAYATEQPLLLLPVPDWVRGWEWLFPTLACPLPLDLLKPQALHIADEQCLDEKSAGDSDDEVLSQVSTQATTDLAEIIEQAAYPKQLPEEVWATIFTMMPKVKEVVGMAFVAKGFHEIVMSPAAWAGTVVHLPPSSLTKFAPVLPSWLGAWSKIFKLVVPRSQHLLTELARHAPNLPVEITWRFDSHLKGDGVEVLNCGNTVRRIGEEELVVLGDAALPCGPGKKPYLEVRLDQQGEAQGDGLNDIGIGVTACNPKDLHELGAVADEVPRSWVIDFTANTVCLSVSNREAAKSRNLSAEDLNEGDRVGLLLLEDAFEIYINGEFRDRIVPAPEDRVPLNIGLYPVLDLYGRTVQVSHTDYEEPTP